MSLLDPSAYKIVWIAPLEIEARAALLLLDRRHDGRFPVDPNDDYTYEAGELCGYNVVIATLPSGDVYGTGSAAAIASHAKKFFKNLWLGLLVGVAAGLPNLQRDPPLDIRLGDILVGLPDGDNAGLIPYDLGKETDKDGFQPLRFGHALAQTHTLVRSAIGSIKLAPNDTDLFLPYYENARKKRDGRGLFADPGQEHDILYQVDNEERVLREPRPTSERTRVWYGPIGSGDKLIKNARKRNELRDRYNIIGLEMEAAGTMNCIPVGVIRGVCDYGDVHKNKRWQPYAAAMAAAYAKAVLARIPPRFAVRPDEQVIRTDIADEMTSRLKRPFDSTSASIINRRPPKSPRNSSSDEAFSQPLPDPVSRTQQADLDDAQREALLRSLNFDQMNSRYQGIDIAYGETCKWLSRTPEYLDWFELNKLQDHHGFLWIKGHPGAGKSTLMKSALDFTQKTKGGSFISFFFTARGHELESSTIGMYRSLLYQLLTKLPRLQTVFSLGLAAQDGNIPQWSLQSLKSLFKHAVQDLGQSPLTCFIDGLDECGDTHIRDMISFLETVAENAVSSGISFRVCLSSRHYPHITISKCIDLDVGKQIGHDQDIISYVKGKLKIGSGKRAQQIRAELIKKASGIFIWVLLVVGILQREHDDGHTHALMQRLKDIPGDLDELFRDIISRDGRNKAELLLSIQWVLFSRQPLRHNQLYLATLVGVDPDAVSNWDSDQAGDEDIKRFILSSSKGLIEVNKSIKDPKVQFIHESVREFFLRDGLRRIWPELEGDFRGESHERLKKCCVKYISIASTSRGSEYERPASSRQELRTSTESKFPFLSYAFQSTLYHANEAAEFGVDQTSFLRSFDFVSWLRLESIFEQYGNRLHDPTTSLLYILAECNAAKLIECHPEKLSGFQVETGDQRYGMPILAAVATNSREAVGALLKAQADAEPPASQLHSLYKQYDRNEASRSGSARSFTFSKKKTILVNLVAAGDEQVVAFAIASDKMNLNVDWKGMEGASAASHAARNGHDTMLRLFLDKGVNLEEPDESTKTPLHYSARNGHTSTVLLLLHRGALIYNITAAFREPLHFAAEGGHTAAVQLLLDKGANKEAACKFGNRPLHLAAQRGHEAVVRRLLDQGADPLKPNYSGITPLHFAAREGQTDVVGLLLERGANREAIDSHGIRPLHLAAKGGHEAVVRLLLDQHAYVLAADKIGNTPLLFAVQKGREAVAKLLLGRGANIYARGLYGRTPYSVAMHRPDGDGTRKFILEQHDKLEPAGKRWQTE